MQFLLKLPRDRQLTGQVLTAMFTLQRHFLPKVDIIEKYGEKISRHSLREIEIKIAQFSAECGKGGSVIAAKAILEMINHRSRQRLEW